MASAQRLAVGPGLRRSRPAFIHGGGSRTSCAPVPARRRTRRQTGKARAAPYPRVYRRVARSVFRRGPPPRRGRFPAGRPKSLSGGSFPSGTPGADNPLSHGAAAAEAYGRPCSAVGAVVAAQSLFSGTAACGAGRLRPAGRLKSLPARVSLRHAGSRQSVVTRRCGCRRMDRLRNSCPVGALARPRAVPVPLASACCLRRGRALSAGL